MYYVEVFPGFLFWGKLPVFFFPVWNNFITLLISHGMEIPVLNPLKSGETCSRNIQNQKMYFREYRKNHGLWGLVQKGAKMGPCLPLIPFVPGPVTHSKSIQRNHLCFPLSIATSSIAHVEWKKEKPSFYALSQYMRQEAIIVYQNAAK